MSRTLQEYMYDVRSLVDELNNNGTILSDDNITTLETNGIRFADMGQKELYKVLKNYGKYEISNKLIPNLLGNLSNFYIEEFIGEDQLYDEEGHVGATAYYFEVDNDADIYIEEFSGTWDILETINVTGITSFTSFKGLITTTNNSYPVRLRMSGTTYYRHVNRCLFSYPFKATSIPNYQPYYLVTMPEDYGNLDDIILEQNGGNYHEDSMYKWEAFNELYVYYGYVGKIRINYLKKPTTLTALTDIVTINNPIAEQALIYYIASKVAVTSEKDLVDLYEDKMAELKFESKSSRPSAVQPIESSYQISSRWG